jgi:hypothetical protein
MMLGYIKINSLQVCMVILPYFSIFISPEGSLLQSRTNVIRCLVSGTHFATAGSIPANLEYVVRQGYISRDFFIFAIWPILSEICGI